ncbi:hypothetical protein C8R47DRAFT_1064216 [Mycena vitilis]|nr:hypothetical protein C8R47DRAFT_1064216 [Mycena vitilis]
MCPARPSARPGHKMGQKALPVAAPAPWKVKPDGRTRCWCTSKPGYAPPLPPAPGASHNLPAARRRRRTLPALEPAITRRTALTKALSSRAQDLLHGRYRLRHLGKRPLPPMASGYTEFETRQRSGGGIGGGWRLEPYKAVSETERESMRNVIHGRRSVYGAQDPPLCNCSRARAESPAAGKIAHKSCRYAAPAPAAAPPVHEQTATPASEVLPDLPVYALEPIEHSDSASTPSTADTTAIRTVTANSTVRITALFPHCERGYEESGIMLEPRGNLKRAVSSKRTSVFEAALALLRWLVYNPPRLVSSPSRMLRACTRTRRRRCRYTNTPRLLLPPARALIVAGGIAGLPVDVPRRACRRLYEAAPDYAPLPPVRLVTARELPPAPAPAPHSEPTVQPDLRADLQAYAHAPTRPVAGPRGSHAQPPRGSSPRTASLESVVDSADFAHDRRYGLILTDEPIAAAPRAPNSSPSAPHQARGAPEGRGIILSESETTASEEGADGCGALASGSYERRRAEGLRDVRGGTRRRAERDMPATAKSARDWETCVVRGARRGARGDEAFEVDGRNMERAMRGRQCERGAETVAGGTIDTKVVDTGLQCARYNLPREKQWWIHRVRGCYGRIAKELRDAVKSQGLDSFPVQVASQTILRSVGEGKLRVADDGDAAKRCTTPRMRETSPMASTDQLTRRDYRPETGSRGRVGKDRVSVLRPEGKRGLVSPLSRYATPHLFTTGQKTRRERGLESCYTLLHQMTSPLPAVKAGRETWASSRQCPCATEVVRATVQRAAGTSWSRKTRVQLEPTVSATRNQRRSGLGDDKSKPSGQAEAESWRMERSRKRPERGKTRLSHAIAQEGVVGRAIEAATAVYPGRLAFVICQRTKLGGADRTLTEKQDAETKTLKERGDGTCASAISQSARVLLIL